MKVRVIANEGLMNTVLVQSANGDTRLLDKVVWAEGGNPHEFDSDEAAFSKLQKPKDFSSIAMTPQEFNEALWRAGMYDKLPIGHSVSKNRVSGILAKLSLPVSKLLSAINNQ